MGVDRDLAPAENDDDTPKSFKRLFWKPIPKNKKEEKTGLNPKLVAINGKKLGDKSIKGSNTASDSFSTDAPPTRKKRTERLREIKIAKKQKKMKKSKESDDEERCRPKDQIRFGEVAQAPPKLTAKPKLKNLIKKDKIKSLYLERVISAEREKAIAQYRLLKQRNRVNTAEMSSQQ